MDWNSKYLNLIKIKGIAVAFYLIPAPSIYYLGKAGKEGSTDKTELIGNVPLYLIYANIVNCIIFLVYGWKSYKDIGNLIWYNLFGIGVNFIFIMLFFFYVFMENKIKFLLTVIGNAIAMVALFFGKIPIFTFKG